MGYIRNGVIIAAPVDKVFLLTNNVRTWPTLFTEYESSEVLEESTDTVTFRLTTRPDEQGKQYSWIAKRRTDVATRRTYSERMPSSGPFEKMVIRWWYDPIDTSSTCMTWEQEFAMKPAATLSEDDATAYLNKQTRIQQKAIKEKIEEIYRSSGAKPPLYRGVVVSRLLAPENEHIIREAFAASDATELPYLAGIQTRRLWVQGDLMFHILEGRKPIPSVMCEFADHPELRSIQQAVDSRVELIFSAFTADAREIYYWHNER